MRLDEASYSARKWEWAQLTKYDKLDISKGHKHQLEKFKLAKEKVLNK